MAELKRRLRRVDGLAIALGTVIGIGVFRTTGVVLRGAHGFAGATLLWVIGGVLVLGGAVLYADLSSRVPEAGGPYATCASRSAAARRCAWLDAPASRSRRARRRPRRSPASSSRRGSR
jgi:amino acid permease